MPVQVLLRTIRDLVCKSFVYLGLKLQLLVFDRDHDDHQILKDTNKNILPLPSCTLYGHACFCEWVYSWVINSRVMLKFVNL